MVWKALNQSQLQPTPRTNPLVTLVATPHHFSSPTPEESEGVDVQTSDVHTNLRELGRPYPISWNKNTFLKGPLVNHYLNHQLRCCSKSINVPPKIKLKEGVCVFSGKTGKPWKTLFNKSDLQNYKDAYIIHYNTKHNHSKLTYCHRNSTITFLKMFFFFGGWGRKFERQKVSTTNLLAAGRQRSPVLLTCPAAPSPQISSSAEPCLGPKHSMSSMMFCRSAQLFERNVVSMDEKRFPRGFE